MTTTIPSDIAFPDTPFPLEPSLVLLGRRGSEAHGTFIPSTDPDSIDDRDLMGICIPPLPWTLGLRDWQSADAIKGVWDVVLYDLRKFVRLLIKQNTNVLGMLWLEPEDYLFVGPVGRALIDNRLLFRERHAFASSVIGYAEGQFKKMHNGACQGYMGAKRKELVERHGFDCKMAGHTIRLLHMGSEFLETGELKVRRTWDREMLIEIKTGKWSLMRVQSYAAEYLKIVRGAEVKSVLPDAIDFQAVEKLVVESMLSAIR
jgi:hypothetical protein